MGGSGGPKSHEGFDSLCELGDVSTEVALDCETVKALVVLNIREDEEKINVASTTAFMPIVDDYMDFEFSDMDSSAPDVVKPIDILEKKVMHSLTDINTFTSYRASKILE